MTVLCVYCCFHYFITITDSLLSIFLCVDGLKKTYVNKVFWYGICKSPVSYTIAPAGGDNDFWILWVKYKLKPTEHQLIKKKSYIYYLIFEIVI